MCIFGKQSSFVLFLIIVTNAVSSATGYRVTAVNTQGESHFSSPVNLYRQPIDMKKKP